MTTTDVQDRLYDLHAGLTPNQRAVLYVEQVRRSRNSVRFFIDERSGPLQDSAMARACTNLYGCIEQAEDAYDATDRTLSRKRVLRDVVILVGMINFANKALEVALHEIGLRAAAVVRMLQLAVQRVDIAIAADEAVDFLGCKPEAKRAAPVSKTRRRQFVWRLRLCAIGADEGSGRLGQLGRKAFLYPVLRVRSSLYELLRSVYTEQAVVEAISKKYFYGNPILFREKERQLAHTITWLLAAIDEYNAFVSQKFDSGESSDDCAVDSEPHSEVTDTVNSLNPEAIRAAVSPDDYRQHVRLVETAGLCQSLVATGDGAAAMDLLADYQRERPTRTPPC